MRFYEIVFIARQDATSAQVEALAQQYTQVIEKLGGKVAKTELCGLRTLAYPIKKNKKGHYVLFNLGIEPQQIAELERQMSLNESILRYLVINIEELDPQPSLLMQQKSFDGRRFDDDYDMPMSNSGQRDEHEFEGR